MVLPQAVLRAAVRGPALVELKNGDSYSGTLAAVDNLMNIRLEDAVFTPRSEHKFERLKECTIRGQFVKFVRFPDDILDRLTVRQEASSSSASRWKGRGKASGKGVPENGRTVTVPASMIGAIIGRGGDTIKRISTDSGARIEVSKDQLETFDDRAIFLSGSIECVERAADMIAAFVRDRAGGGRSRQQPHPQDRQGSGKGQAQHLAQAGDGRGRGCGGWAGGKGGGRKGGGDPFGKGIQQQQQQPMPAAVGQIFQL
ncbi:unnamed protein product [Polarella glacialis]|uniref:Sm domain-containing protein n=1 Tax=Polarella glacialis TaxID=89957 RepID=A0A813HZ02_POLGL|nr:unnamed protein product [Polarella glacialis]CAE8689815.1 unnamed protein product [Polarella glacialis]